MNPSTLLTQFVRFLLRRLLPVMSLVLLVSCGGSNSSVTPPASQDGSIALSINDAAGDFVSYVVAITQVTLTRDDGAVVQALPVPVSIDLAQLVDSSSLFGTATLPSGTYTSMTVTLDYSSADIAAENAAGQVVTLAPVTQSGATAGTVSATIKFASSASLVVRQGEPTFASLDFDLEASNAIDFNASPPTVTVTPVLYATANPSDLPYAQASGMLVSVDTNASTYKINIVPLFYTGTNDFGSLVVATGAETAFLVNGTPYVGADGLQAMTNLAAGTPTLAFGTYNPASGQFAADEVSAGTSVPGVDADMVHGSVIGRSGDLLTVRGQTYVKAAGETIYHTIVAVSLGSNSIVYKAGDPSAKLAIDDVSVGQQVTILGTLTDTNTSSLAMDAGASATGYVRLSPSRVEGVLVSMASPDVVVNVSDINHHSVSWYDFSGTGTTSETDADPANYDINVGTVDLSALSIGEPVEFTGFVQSFGQAPPDFNAEEIGNYKSNGSGLMVAWRPDGTTSPFSTQSTTQLVIDLQNPNIGPIAVLRRAGPPVPLTSLPASPAIVPPANGTGVFAISQSGTITMYVGFSAFVNAIQTQMTGNTTMAGFVARGGYDAALNTFTAARISVNLK